MLTTCQTTLEIISAGLAVPASIAAALIAYASITDRHHR
jgi:hypothetical protein